MGFNTAHLLQKYCKVWKNAVGKSWKNSGKKSQPQEDSDMGLKTAQATAELLLHLLSMLNLFPSHTFSYFVLQKICRKMKKNVAMEMFTKLLQKTWSTRTAVHIAVEFRFAMNWNKYWIWIINNILNICRKPERLGPRFISILIWNNLQ